MPKKRISSCHYERYLLTSLTRLVLKKPLQELYTQDYYSIEWAGQGNNVCKVDLFAPHSAIFDWFNVVLVQYEKCSLPSLRCAALDRVYKLIKMEDENTDYQGIGAVNKMMNLIVRWHVDGPDSEAFGRHRRRCPDFLWLGKEGLMVTGTNGSQLWDTAFISQAIVETGLAAEEVNRESCIKALEWLDDAQIKGNSLHFGKDYRHQSKGAWSFSTRSQSYTAGDSVGEGLKAVLYLQEHLEYAFQNNPLVRTSDEFPSFTPKLISNKRMQDAVNVMLSLQNPDGGIGSYEVTRGPQWLELLNPAEVFGIHQTLPPFLHSRLPFSGQIMVERGYPECTTSAITALSIFRKHYPNYRSTDIECVARRGDSFVLTDVSQELYSKGSWVPPPIAAASRRMGWQLGHLFHLCCTVRS